MSCKFPSLLKCFLFTLKQATTNLACAPFFCFAVFFYSFYYCWPYMEQLPDHLNVVAVDQDNSALSRRLTQAMRASPNLQVTQQTTSLPEAQNLMRKGGISAILIIPPNFETHTLTNVPTALVLVTNGAFIVKSRGSMSGVGGPLQKIVAASISAHLVEHGVPLSEIARAANNPPSMIVESMFNTVNGYLNFTVPIVFMIIFQTIFVCGIGMLMNDWFWKRKYPFPAGAWRPPSDVLPCDVRTVFLPESFLDLIH
ncbi:MAG: ABC transporter permease [Parasutterella sp.]